MVWGKTQCKRCLKKPAKPSELGRKCPPGVARDAQVISSTWCSAWTDLSIGTGSVMSAVVLSSLGAGGWAH